MMFNRSRQFFVFSYLMSNALICSAESQSTPGAIAQLTVPKGWQYSYQAENDTNVLRQSRETQAFVFMGPDEDPRQILTNVLIEMGAKQYVRRIKETEISTRQASLFKYSGTGRNEYWSAIDFDDASIVFRVISSKSQFVINTFLEQVVNSIVVAPAQNPKGIKGSYSPRSDNSKRNHSGALGNQENSMSLNPDGSIIQSNDEDMGKTDSAMNIDKNSIGKWHIRGNRLIVQLKDGRFDNVAFKEVIQ